MVLDRLVDAFGVVRAVGADRSERPFDLHRQRGYAGSVGRALAGEIRRDDLASTGVDRNVEFAPIPVSWRLAEVADMDREPRAVDQNVDWLVASGRTDRELPELLGPSLDRRVVGDSAVQTEQREQRSEEAFCLPQTKMENHAGG